MSDTSFIRFEVSQLLLVYPYLVIYSKHMAVHQETFVIQKRSDHGRTVALRNLIRLLKEEITRSQLPCIPAVRSLSFPINFLSVRHSGERSSCRPYPASGRHAR